MSVLNDITSWLQSAFGNAPFGISYPEYLSAGGILLGSIMFALLMRPVLNSLVVRYASRKDRVLRDQIVNALVPPIRVLPVIFGLYFALGILHLKGNALDVAGQILVSLVIATTFWAFARLTTNTDLLWDRLSPSLDPSVRRWLGCMVGILVLVSAGAIILQIWDIPVAPLIGSLGVFGIAVGLAAKDLFSNLISGILIMTERRFGVGDWIQVEGVVNGTVEEINFRSTRIRAFDLTPVYVPNSALADNAMTNYTRMTHWRIYWTVGLEYGTPPDKLEEIRDKVESWLTTDKRICQPPEASLFVRIDNFGESSINLMIYCFTRTTDWGEWLKIKEDFALALIPIVKAAGSGFAFPSRSVFLRQMDQPEIINPEGEAKT